jgi:hypothetical protein
MKFAPKSVFGIIAGGILLSSSAFALDTGAVSAGAFHPASNADVPYITDYGEYVTNSDSSASHWVSGHLGLYNGTSQSITFMGDNNGGTLTCYVFVVAESNLNTNFYSNSTTVNGTYGITVTVPASLTSPAVLSGYCSIPAHNANGYSEMYLVK